MLVSGSDDDDDDDDDDDACMFCDSKMHYETAIPPHNRENRKFHSLIVSGTDNYSIPFLNHFRIN